jgi:hypothetical protein
LAYAKRPFAVPEPILAYLSRYTHRAKVRMHKMMTLGVVQVIGTDAASGRATIIASKIANPGIYRYAKRYSNRYVSASAAAL